MGIIKLDGFERIYAVEQFPKEWEKLFKKQHKKRIAADDWLANNLALLDENAALQTMQNHEHYEPVISSHPQLYSIHNKSELNQRVLYYIITEKNEVLLLTAFIEKKKSDYDLATQRAENRIKHLHREKEI